MWFSPLLGPNILLSTLFSYTISVRFSCNVSDLVSCPYKTSGEIIFQLILIFIFFRSKLEDQNSAPNYSKRSLTSVYSEFILEGNFDSLVLLHLLNSFTLSKDLRFRPAF